MTRRDRLLQLFLVWLAVYPAVLLFSYLFVWLGLDWPRWLQILISTAFTVPLISFVAVPAVEQRIASAKGESRADLKRQQADAVEDQ